jgi:methionyl-tRNA formyltransferase
LSLTIVFMGTPDFSVPILSALLDAGHRICCVYSQPPRPAGRGHQERLSPVHAFAESQGLLVRAPKTLRDADVQASFAQLGADVGVVAAYGLILPKAVLDSPRFGCLNVHASLLPRWRWAAPIQRAILAGDRLTGVTIMQMDQGLDTGAMLLQDDVPITESTDATSLHDGLSAIGARLIVEALTKLETGDLTAEEQPAEGVTYASKLMKDEGRLDWALPAVQLERAIRAFTPWPGAWFDYEGERFKVLAAAVVDGSGPPGTLLDAQLSVACGEGALRLLKIQRPGRAVLDAEAFLRGYPLAKGLRISVTCPATS